MKLNNMTKDLPMLRKNMEKIDNNRLARLRTMRQDNAYKGVLAAWIEEKGKPKILSEKQRMAIHLLTDMVNNYSNEYIISRLNIAHDTFARWRNDPLFITETDKEITRRKSYMRLHAFRNVNRAIARGDMKATWNYLKMSGDLRENINHTIDPTGEKELSDDELKREIAQLTNKLARAHEPSTS